MPDKSQLDIIWVIVAAVLVIAMQGGFLCLESGMTRTKNSINVALKNAVDFSVAIIIFWFFGFGLMFGDSSEGYIGSDLFAPNLGSEEPWLATFYLFQAMFCATAATIVSGAIAERVKFNSYILITIIIAGLIYPVYGHWAWGNFYLENSVFLADKGFVDFAGSTVVHSLGGWVALALVIIIGPRTGRFSDGKPVNIAASNLPMAMLGLLLFVVGWVGFNGGSTLEFSSNIPGIIANTVIAAAVGMAAAYILRPVLSPSMDEAVAPINGALAGLVAITANCHVVYAIDAFIIATLAAIIMLACDRLLLKLKLDDAIGAIPVHLAAGIWGTLAVGIFGDLELLATGLSRTEQIIIQLQGIVVCGLWAFGISYILFSQINKNRPLRVSADDEYIGLNMAEHGAHSPLYELIEVMDWQTQSFNLSMRAPEEPFTEVGQIAKSYNRVVSALERETNKTKQIIKDIKDGIITFTKDGLLTSMNPGAEKILQVDGAGVIGLPVNNVFIDSGFDTQYRENRKSNDNNGLLDNDLTQIRACDFHKKDEAGRRLIVDYKSYAGHNSGKEHYTAILRDVSEQRIAEELLFLEKEHAQVTLESIGEGVITTDENDCVVYINPVAEEIIGLKEDEANGKDLNELLKLYKEGSEEVLKLGLKAASIDVTRIKRYGQLVLKKTDASDVSIKLTVSPVRNREGQIIGSVLVFQDISKSREMERVLSYQASHDPITGLLNRREFEERLSELIRTARIDGHHHIICYVDLDQFKIVNDTCGHNAGDELLRQLTVLLSETLRGSDTLARLGGDEFGILLNNCEMSVGSEIANNVRKKVEEFRFTWEKRTFSVGASIGIAGISKHSDSAAEIMSMADAACYAAKDAGRNRVHIHEPDDNEVKLRWGQMQWASKIQEAIDQDRLRLFFQEIAPIKDELDDGHRHYEIFVRMLDKDGSIVPPGAFIPAAERYDLMTSIDKWVVKNALSWMGSNNQADILSINLSGASINNQEFLDTIKEQIEHYEVNPSLVCFEVTETAAINDMVKAKHFIDELKQLGCKFSLDDFGSGLSSFGYLKALPVDYLKIDGMFVRDIVHDKFDQAMVESINSIGQLMGLKTIAEFVENEEIIKKLKRIGVDYVQGYHIGKPAPLEELYDTSLWPRTANVSN